MEDLPAIRALHEQNLSRNVSEEEKEREGFVSVETDLPLLKRVRKDAGIMVAEHPSEGVVAYAVPLTLEHAQSIPLLTPFIERVLRLSHQKTKLSDLRVVIAGQLCIARGHKGIGLPEPLHHEFLRMLRGKF